MTAAPAGLAPETPTTPGPLFSVEREAPGLMPPARDRDPRRVRRRRRALVAAAIGLLAVVLALVALTAGGSSGGDLDPRSADPSGTRALAELLRDRGVTVERGGNTAPGRTVVVPFVADLDDDQLDTLLDSGADVVLIDPGPLPHAQLQERSSLSLTTRAPRCDLPAARTAGAVRLGGPAYATTATADGASCYDGTLLVLPAGSVSAGSGRLTVLGDAGFLTNAHLASEGDAALALGLLSDHPQLTWYTARRTSGGTTLTDLLPGVVGWVILQLGITVVLVALWRVRRLGPVVDEPLPVVVRAGETVIGRARLYASARARSTAAEALRSGSRARLGVLLHLDPTSAPDALVAAVAARVTPDAATVAAILYGARPPASNAHASNDRAFNDRASHDIDSDAALVRLATDLDRLEREVARR